MDNPNQSSNYSVQGSSSPLLSPNVSMLTRAAKSTVVGIPALYDDGSSLYSHSSKIITGVGIKTFDVPPLARFCDSVRNSLKAIVSTKPKIVHYYIDRAKLLQVLECVRPNRSSLWFDFRPLRREYEKMEVRCMSLKRETFCLHILLLFLFRSF